MRAPHALRSLAGALVLSLGVPVGLAAPPAQPAEVIAPNENLVAEGIPPVPKALAEKVAPYNEVRSATFAGWHPTRREMLVSTRFGDVAQIHRVAMPMGARTQLTFYPERVARATWRPGKGDGFVFAMDVGGGEWYQLYWRDAATGKVTMFTDGRSRNTMGAFARDGSFLAYQSTKRTGKDNDVYVVDPADPKSEKLILPVEGGGWGVRDVSPDGKTLLVGEYLSANESRFWLVDRATGKKTHLVPEPKEKVAWEAGSFSADGRRVFATTDAGSEFQRLVAVDLATRKVELLLLPEVNWDVASVEPSDDGKWLAYVVNEAGVDTLHVLDLASRKEIRLPSLPKGMISGVRFHANSRDLAFAISSARSPFDVWSIDVTEGRLDRWTESEVGGLDTSAFSEPEAIAWKGLDGLPITGFLYLPPKGFAGPHPVIIDIHGGPEGQWQPYFLGRRNTLIHDLGVAVIFPNVRGSSGFGKTFLTLDNGEKREDSVKDIGALLDWIKGRGELDATRVMVTGGSYGGYMTLAAMTHYNDRLRCGLDVVGISNFVTFLERTESYRRDLRRAEYGDERKPVIRAFMERTAPLNNAAKITKPMFVVQGKNDPRVPVTEAEQMVAAIRKNGGPVWYLLAKDEGHGFSKKKNADFQFLATLEFVRSFLLN